MRERDDHLPSPSFCLSWRNRFQDDSTDAGKRVSEPLECGYVGMLWVTFAGNENQTCNDLGTYVLDCQKGGRSKASPTRFPVSWELLEFISGGVTRPGGMSQRDFIGPTAGDIGRRALAERGVSYTSRLDFPNLRNGPYEGSERDCPRSRDKNWGRASCLPLLLIFAHTGTRRSPSCNSAL